MKVKIKNWHSVATWKWDIQNADKCTICQSDFEAPCPRCRIPGDDCVPVQGQCSHHFHMHCILKWTEQGSSQQCPLCRKKWALKH